MISTRSGPPARSSSPRWKAGSAPMPKCNPDAFWPALKPLVEAGFGPPGAAGAAPAQTAYRDPGFQLMSYQAKANRDVCEQRQRNMGPVGAHARRSGQAGASGTVPSSTARSPTCAPRPKHERPPRRRPSNRPLSLPCRRCRRRRRRQSPPMQPPHRGRRPRRIRARPCRRNASSSSPTTSPPRRPMTDRRPSPATMR